MIIRTMAALAAAVVAVGCGGPGDLIGGSGGSGGSSGGSGGGTGTGGGTKYCYRSKALTSSPACDCYPSAQDRSTSDYDVVSSCGGSGQVCFADVRTSGLADSCSCFIARCLQDGDKNCQCTSGDVDSGLLTESTSHVVSSCPAITGQHCCRDKQFGDCYCTPGYCSGGGNVEEIPSCTPSIPKPVSTTDSPVKDCSAVRY